MAKEPKKKDFRAQASEELMYWRGRLGFPDLTPQMSIAGAGKPEVDSVARKQFDVLVETLLSRAANLQHLDRIVSELRASHKACPTPPEIHAAADLVDRDAEGEADQKPATCPFSECDGHRFIVDATGARFCRCHAAYKEPKGGNRVTANSADCS